MIHGRRGNIRGRPDGCGTERVDGVTVHGWAQGRRGHARSHGRRRASQSSVASRISSTCGPLPSKIALPAVPPLRVQGLAMPSVVTRRPPTHGRWGWALLPCVVVAECRSCRPSSGRPSDGPWTCSMSLVQGQGGVSLGRRRGTQSTGHVLVGRGAPPPLLLGAACFTWPSSGHVTCRL